MTVPLFRMRKMWQIPSWQQNWQYAQGADIEAELGSMGKTESGEGVGSGEDDETKIYTDPVQAKDFVARTGVNALACSLAPLMVFI